MLPPTGGFLLEAVLVLTAGVEALITTHQRAFPRTSHQSACYVSSLRGDRLFQQVLAANQSTTHSDQFMPPTSIAHNTLQFVPSRHVHTNTTTIEAFSHAAIAA